MRHATRRRPGFTLTELLVVIGIIALLLGLLLPALAGVISTGAMGKSMASMRQIGVWMRMYAEANREFIVPSRFDYSDHAYPGKVRSGGPYPGQCATHCGTWTDILWTEFKLGDDRVGLLGEAYRYDSPDEPIHRSLGDDFENTFRSAAANTDNFPIGQSGVALAKPFGDGAQEKGLPGYFAANDFFDARPYAFLGKEFWFQTGQIKVPERSMYLVDSLAGEVIGAHSEDPLEAARPAFNPDPTISPRTLEVDFRYNDYCLMLMLDGHAEALYKWTDETQTDPIEGGICDLEAPGGRGIRIRRPLSRGLPDDCR